MLQSEKPTISMITVCADDLNSRRVDESTELILSTGSALRTFSKNCSATFFTFGWSTGFGFDGDMPESRRPTLPSCFIVYRIVARARRLAARRWCVVVGSAALLEVAVGAAEAVLEPEVVGVERALVVAPRRRLEPQRLQALVDVEHERLRVVQLAVAARGSLGEHLRLRERAAGRAGRWVSCGRRRW